MTLFTGWISAFKNAPAFLKALIHPVNGYLEQRIDQKEFKELINNNSARLIGILNKRITDQFGASQLKLAYPKLCAYLHTNYNELLPAPLKKGLFESLAHVFFNLFKGIKPPATMQGIKDQLVINFFKKVIASSERPDVIRQCLLIRRRIPALSW